MHSSDAAHSVLSGFKRAQLHLAKTHAETLLDQSNSEADMKTAAHTPAQNSAAEQPTGENRRHFVERAENLLY